MYNRIHMASHRNVHIFAMSRVPRREGRSKALAAVRVRIQVIAVEVMVSAILVVLPSHQEHVQFTVWLYCISMSAASFFCFVCALVSNQMSS